jgi:para-nitrobenzyl esterase
MKRREFLFAASATAALGQANLVNAAGAPPLTQTRQGRLEGIEEDGVLKFLGVPFAMPPVGALR